MYQTKYILHIKGANIYCGNRLLYAIIFKGQQIKELIIPNFS